ncbi:glycosylase [bacterium]|nr:glycosylase [bacterium]
MIQRLFEKCLLRPQDLFPSREELEVVGVFNPGVIDSGGEVVIMARVSEQTRERRSGQVALPRWDIEGGGIVVDWVGEDEIRPIDPRVVEMRETGQTRLTFTSHIRLLRSRDGRILDSFEGLRFDPDNRYEEFGVEDPRITRIGQTYYITYVAVSRHGAATALASTTDFETFERHGVIFPPENKDVVLFPEKIGGEYVALHRPNPRTHFSSPEIWLARTPDFVHWGKHEVLHGGSSLWDSGRIGAGCPPIRVPEGWLEIYHGNRRVPGGVGPYAAGALLLDPENPGVILRRSPEPLLVPEADFEREGFVRDVVFPTGIVERGETLLIYYGAADTAVGVVELARDEILGSL